MFHERSATRSRWPRAHSSLDRVKAVISMAGDAYPFDQRGVAALKVPIMASCFKR